MEKYVKPTLARENHSDSSCLPIEVAEVVGFLAGLASGDSHSVGGRNVEHLEEKLGDNGVR